MNNFLSVAVSRLGGDGWCALSGDEFHSGCLSGPHYPWYLWGILDEEEEVPTQRLAQGELLLVNMPVKATVRNMIYFTSNVLC